MKIKKQPIISKLLDENYKPTKFLEITVPNISNLFHVKYLSNGLRVLNEVSECKPDWGLPELLMPSFKNVMVKSAKSFYNIDHQLFQDFSENGVCGILLDKQFGTIVYGFQDNTLYVWLFREVDGYSVLYNFFYLTSTPDNVRHFYCCPTLTNDPQLFKSGFSEKEKSEMYSIVANLLTLYLAVKKYAKVETIVVPINSKLFVEDEIQGYKQKKKVLNESGQEVIIMDSRWFVKIINDNNIFVRGFFRFQRYKNEFGEWDKKLIFVDSFIRHGYHRNAKIEDESSIEGELLEDKDRNN